ncbi:hypothetical protein [Luteibacter sp. RCC_6_2]|uniref:hypothetical protein n=1 Tax=Luteibacter sp. RCC_6_2 TaxID=3239223 RepID=UPI003524F947
MFDDYPNIVDNAQVQPQSLSLASLVGAAMSSPSSELKRPLSSLTFALDYVANGGLNSSSMKATNIVLHAMNGVLLYFLFTALFRFRARDEREWANAILWAVFAAMAWLLLPINLTAVLYVVQRMESLANLFVLAGLFGYVHSRIRMQQGGQGFLQSATWLVVPTLLGTAAKETSVLLPLYALCVESFVFGFRLDRQSFKVDWRFVWFYVVILGVPLVVGLTWIGPGLLDARTWGTRNFTLWTRLLSEARIVLDYISWTVFPTAGNLSFYHDAFVQSTGWLNPPSTLWSAIGLATIIGLAWSARNHAPLVTLGVFWFFACHTLTGTVLPLELVYEHRNYFASIGIVLAVSEALRYASVRLSTASKYHLTFRHLPLMVGIALTIWAAALTARTAQAWGTPLSLAEELAARGPESPRAQYELGRAYIIASRYEPDSPYVAKAREALERAAALPGSSILAEQALVFMYGRMNLPVRSEWWIGMQRKLSQQPVTVQDDSSLLALATCVEQELCRFDTTDLDKTFRVALAKPGVSARLKAAYGIFASQILHDDGLAFRMAQEAVTAAPDEPAYRVHYAQVLIAHGELNEARRQLTVLESMNMGGRLEGDLSSLRNRLEAKIRNGEDSGER